MVWALLVSEYSPGATQKFDRLLCSNTIRQAIGTPECLDPLSRELEPLFVRVDNFQIGATPTDGLGLYWRHLEEPLRNDVARLFQISRLWVRNIGNRHHTKRQIQRIIRRIIPRLARLPPCLLLRYQAAKRPDRHRGELGQDVSVVFAAEFATQLAGSG